MTRFSLITLLLCGLLVQACINQDFSTIELRADFTGNFEVIEQPTSFVDTTAQGTIIINNFQEKLDLAHISFDAIDKISASSATVVLNSPSDTIFDSFEFFRNFSLALQNDTDSIAFAEIGSFTDTTSATVTLRTIDSNVKNILASDDYWLEMNFSLDTDTLLTDTIDIDLTVEWLMTGEY